MSVTDNVKPETPSFFSESQVDAWVKSNHDQLVELKKLLIRTIVPIMGTGAVFGVVLAFLLGKTMTSFIGILSLVLILFFLVSFLMTAERFTYYVRWYFKEKKGIWFAILKCGCDKWIKALDKQEVEKCKNHDEKMLSSCFTCNLKEKKRVYYQESERRTYVMQVTGQAETKNDDTYLKIPDEETCAECREKGDHHDKCKACGEAIKIVKLWRKRVK